MSTFAVEFFGLPYEITGKREVVIELPSGAKLADLIAALRRRTPALEGNVIRKGENRLAEHYGFYIKGRFYVDDSDLELHEGDRIRLLTLASRG